MFALCSPVEDDRNAEVSTDDKLQHMENRLCLQGEALMLPIGPKVVPFWDYLWVISKTGTPNTPEVVGAAVGMRASSECASRNRLKPKAASNAQPETLNPITPQKQVF